MKPQTTDRRTRTKSFQLEDLGKVNYYLGAEVERTEDGGYFIHQRTYIERMLERYLDKDAKTVTTPMVESFDTNYVEEGDELPANKSEYLSLQGAINYAACFTRPDIVFATNYLSGKCAAPQQKHVKMQKRVLRYLKGTADFGLLYKGGCDDCTYRLVATPTGRATAPTGSPSVATCS